jgi:hypothetical protein
VNSQARVLRFGFVAIVALALYVAGARSSSLSRIAFAADPTTVNFGRACQNVIDFGADPSGNSSSDAAFKAAFSAASIRNGAAVCAPAGRYKLTVDITLYGLATTGSTGGFSFYGAGPGLTILDWTGSTTLFDSCPTFSNVTPSMPTPSNCPSLAPTGGTNTPNPGSPLAGIVFSNFSIDVDPTASPGSGFYFPQVNGLLVDNVCVTGSGLNIFDFGQRQPNSFSGIAIRDGTCETSFTGHYIAVHGSGSGLVVEHNDIRGHARVMNNTNLFFDTTDLVSSTVSNVSWLYNDLEGPFLGLFSFLPAPATFGDASAHITNFTSIGNIFDQCAVTCYYFGADNGQNPAPSFSNVRLSDRWAISKYDGVYMDGGYYSAANTGVQDIKIAGPSVYGGADSGLNGLGGSIFMVEGAPSMGFMIDYTAIAVEFGSGLGTAYYKANPGDTPQMMSAGIAGAIGFITTFSSLSAPLANPSYGLVTTRLLAGAPPGYVPYTFTVVVVGTIRPVGAISTCTVPSSIYTAGGPTTAPCITGVVDLGDGLAFHNGAHNVDAVGARLQSPGGAAVHIWPNGVDELHLFNNILGQEKQSTSHIALQFDPGSTAFIHYDFEGNDLVGATPIANPLPTPTFTTGGQAPVMRSNRGALGVTIAQTSVSVSGGGVLTLLNAKNAGPEDCTYYLSSWTGTITSTTVTLSGAPSTALPSSRPSTVFLPVGASMLVSALGSGGVTYSAFCQP